MVNSSQNRSLIALVAMVAACGGNTPAPTGAPVPVPVPMVTAATDTAVESPVNSIAAYRQMGLVASPPPLTFVASPGFFATPSPDTTLVVVSLSLPSRALAFSPAHGSYEAIYSITLLVRQGVSDVVQTNEVDTVRVSAFSETHRDDESILFRHALRLSPGTYTLTYTVRDETMGRYASQHGPLVVPHFLPQTVNRPVVVYSVTPRTTLTEVPQYVPRPRATGVFGVDQTIALYLESYGTHITTPVLLALWNAEDSVVWRDTVWLAQRKGFASGEVTVPLARGDIGRLMVSAVPTGGTAANTGGGDTVWVPLFVRFESGLPQISFAEMVNRLRFFTTLDWLHRLRTAPPDSQAAVWTAFLKAVDSTTGPGGRERLQTYLARIPAANAQFGGDTTQGFGWLSDRGSVFVGLGAPDAAYWEERSTTRGRARVLVWEYRAAHARLVFSNETDGKGRWRLLPASAALFQTILTHTLAG